MSTYNPYSSHYSQPRRVNLWPLFLVLLIGGLVGLGWWFWHWRHANPILDANPRPVAAPGPMAADEEANIEIYQRNAPSVVHVTNLAERRGLFNLDVQQIPKGSGSGFVWDDKGIIVTNHHVIDGADAVEVVLPDKERSAYDVLARVSYPDKDLAVLYIKAPKNKLHRIPEIGSSKDLKVGQKTFAIGNPFGFDQSYSTGIVSALDRTIRSENGRPIEGVIQTTAPINPGNSGGPLLDSSGNLIGVNTAIVSPSGAFAGLGFSIPVDEVNRIVPKLIERLNEILKQNRDREEVSPPRLGVEIAPDQWAKKLGVEEGALIMNVVPRSPAAKAGLRGTILDARGDQRRLGDVIVAIDGKPVNTLKDVLAILEGYHLGDTVTLTVLRNGQRQEVQVTFTPIR